MSGERTGFAKIVKLMIEDKNSVNPEALFSLFNKNIRRLCLKTSKKFGVDFDELHEFMQFKKNEGMAIIYNENHSSTKELKLKINGLRWHFFAACKDYAILLKQNADLEFIPEYVECPLEYKQEYLKFVDILIQMKIDDSLHAFVWYAYLEGQNTLRQIAKWSDLSHQRIDQIIADKIYTSFYHLFRWHKYEPEHIKYIWDCLSEYRNPSPY
jgi:hypothetical protein